MPASPSSTRSQSPANPNAGAPATPNADAIVASVQGEQSDQEKVDKGPNAAHVLLDTLHTYLSRKIAALGPDQERSFEFVLNMVRGAADSENKVQASFFATINQLLVSTMPPDVKPAPAPVPTPPAPAPRS